MGTVILAVVSAGFSLLAIPFYSKRCSICKSTAVSPSPDQSVIGAPATSALTPLADAEARLSLTQQELESTIAELERTRTERDFYRQLLEDPTTREKDRPINQ